MTNVYQFPLFCCDGMDFFIPFWLTVLGLFVNWVLLGVVNFLFKVFLLVPSIKLDRWREIAYLFLLWNDFLYWLWLIVFLGIVLWTGVCDLLAHTKHPPRPFWLTESPFQSQLQFWWVCFYMWLGFISLYFLISFLCFVHSVFDLCVLWVIFYDHVYLKFCMLPVLQ